MPFELRLEDIFEGCFLFIIEDSIILIIIAYFIIENFKHKSRKILKCTPMNSLANFNNH